MFSTVYMEHPWHGRWEPLNLRSLGVCRSSFACCWAFQEIISLVAAEYTKLFSQPSKLTRDEKKAKLLHHLSVSGIYHSFKVVDERLAADVRW